MFQQTVCHNRLPLCIRFASLTFTLFPDVTICPPDAILTCLPAPDDHESGLSHFGAEMRACASIAGGATNKSLVLLDEVGRGTSPHEAFGIVYALAEYLLTRVRPSCPAVFLATHDKQLVTVLDGSADVIVRHLAVQLEVDPSSSTKKIHFPHRILLGDAPECVFLSARRLALHSTSHTDWFTREQTAIDLAARIGLPTRVIERARAHTQALTLLHKHISREEQDRIDALRRRKAAIRIYTGLTQLINDEHDSDVSESSLGKQVLALQQVARDIFGGHAGGVERSGDTPNAGTRTLSDQFQVTDDIATSRAKLTATTALRSYSVTSPTTSASTRSMSGHQTPEVVARVLACAEPNPDGAQGQAQELKSAPRSASPSRLSWLQQLSSL